MAQVASHQWPKLLYTNGPRHPTMHPTLFTKQDEQLVTDGEGLANYSLVNASNVLSERMKSTSFTLYILFPSTFFLFKQSMPLDKHCLVF